MRPNAILGGFGFLVQLLSSCTAYTLAADCTNINSGPSDKLHAVMASFDKMAAYVIGRANDINPLHRPGTLLQDLLGANDENDPAVLALISNWVQQAKDLALGTSTRQGQNVLIYCSDAHLTPINPATGYYRDKEHNNIQVRAPRIGPLAPGVTNACGRQVSAFTYPAGDLSIMILCSDWTQAALYNIQNRPTADLILETHRRDIIGSIPSNPGLDYCSRFLDYTIFHEMMHAASFQQFPSVLPDLDANRQPVRELYGYETITGNPIGLAYVNQPPSANNRQHNGDSFALLACAWYFYPQQWIHGVPSHATPEPPALYFAPPVRSVSNYAIRDINTTSRHVLGIKRRFISPAVIDMRESFFSAF